MSPRSIFKYLSLIIVYLVRTHVDMPKFRTLCAIEDIVGCRSCIETCPCPDMSRGSISPMPCLYSVIMLFVRCLYVSHMSPLCSDVFTRWRGRACIAVPLEASVWFTYDVVHEIQPASKRLGWMGRWKGRGREPEACWAAREREI